MPRGTIDVNADVGEVEDPAELELAVFAVISSANVATGAHAGNAVVMEAAVRKAGELGICVGAHPSYRDREGFGRRVVEMRADDLRDDLTAQISELDEICRSHGTPLRHVKPHGALYHRAMRDEGTARAVVEALKGFPGVSLVGQAGDVNPFASAAGIHTIGEAFVDRGYRSDGTLVPRGDPGDLLTDPRAAAAQAVSLATRHEVTSTDGGIVHVDAETLCMHGDTPGAAAIGRAVRAGLEQAGISVAAPG